MYVPPYDSLLKRIGSTTEQFENTDPVPVPGRLLKLLLQLAVAYSDFDEDGYLRVNSDVRNAVERGQIESGHLHYIGYGYFEGRNGGTAVKSPPASSSRRAIPLQYWLRSSATRCRSDPTAYTRPGATRNTDFCSL